MQPSHNVSRAMAESKPWLRGVIHGWAAAVVAVLGTWAIVRADPGLHRFAVALYVVGAVVMLGLSAGMHARVRDERATERWVRLDHTGIYVMIAAAITSVAVLGLHGGWRIGLVVVAWIGAALGLVVEWWPRATPRGFAHTMFLVNGWTAVLALWRLWLDPSAGPEAVAWLLAGGLCYTVGAVIVALRRPDPWPEHFGYHEIWHVLVVVAVLMHLWLVAVVLR